MSRISAFVAIFIASVGVFHSGLSEAMMDEKDQLTLVVKLVKVSHQEALQETNSPSKINHHNSNYSPPYF